jgi:glycosyltransferase involved in cell wall biosynthesis
MRVVLLTDAFVTENGYVVDGVANTLHRLATYCSRPDVARLVKLTVVTHATSVDSIEHLGPVEILRFRPKLPIPIHPGYAMDAVVGRSRILSAICERKPDLLHIATPGSMGLTGLNATGRLGCPVLGSYHTAYEENIRRRVEKVLQKVHLPHQSVGRFFDRITWAYVTWFFNHMTTVLVPSRYTSGVVRRRFDPPIGLFTRGVDAEQFNPRFRRDNGRLTALHVGRLVVDKNLEVLPRIFAGRRDVSLKVVGEGPEKGWLQQALPETEFTGHLTGNELSVAYASADFFVFPSETETFGNVALEAMASGLPVVASDRMAPQELIRHGVNGYVGKVGSTFETWVDELILNPAQRHRMGVAARRFAERRSWETVFESLIGRYLRVAGGFVPPEPTDGAEPQLEPGPAGPFGLDPVSIGPAPPFEAARLPEIQAH